MILVVDIGNQNVKWMASEKCGRFASCTEQFDENLSRNLGHLLDIEMVVFTSVKGHQSVRSLCAFSVSTWGVEALPVAPVKSQCGVHNPSYSGAELGADRWAALIGAWSINRQACVVVDCGTAITVDALSDNGTFIGGSILPGFSLGLSALGQNTEQIAKLNELTPQLPALSTSEAVSSGVVFGTAGAVDALVCRYLGYAGEHAMLFLTGGDANWLSPRSRYSFELFPQLVLHGLVQIAAGMRAKPA